MEIINQSTEPGAVLRTETLNVDLIRLLSTRYTVVVEQKQNEIVLELYPIIEKWKQENY